ncbi:ADP-ribosylglycohydrolase family protein [Roseateles sp. MS654]|uniref:ADP-ribosylglycohydrolase family protein n=1 Tax=Roseateles sp. MS654 TaxID=3412685 RepID=UPI003C2BB5FE
MTPESLRDRIYASLALAGIGDALGAPTEQWSRDEIAAAYGGLATTFRTPTADTFAGVNAGRIAEVTDDASQMYYLARALAKAGGRLDTAGWTDCLLDWAAHSPKAGFMGPSTAGIVKALREGTDLELVGVIGESRRKLTSMGTTNGAAMRVAPAGLLHPGDVEGACQQALATCLPSHDTEVAISAACSIAAATARAVAQGSLAEVVAAALAGARLGEQLARSHGRSVAGPTYLARLDAALEIAGSSRSVDEVLRRMEALVGNSVLAAESVPAAVGLLVYAKGEPLLTVALGASAGNDTDSIATMAGAIAGAMAGTAGLPRDLLDPFVAANAADFDLDQIADDLAPIAWSNWEGRR